MLKLLTLSVDEEKLESELIQFKKSLMVLCKGLQDPLTAEV